ncbi:MAG: SGNH/GDSL hydrolase family protein [Planctomycetota bacterium]
MFQRYRQRLRVGLNVLLASALLTLLSPATANAEEATPTQLELRRNDRIDFLGGTFFERAQSSGYIEAELTARHPSLDLTFRNLGWSADTVFGSSRPPGRTGAVFGSEEQGFQNLLRQVRDAKPTVVLVAYGFNESFAGADGLERFRKGLDRLLDELKKTTPRLGLLTPHRVPGPAHVSFPRAKRSEASRLFAEAIRSIAKARRLPLADLYEKASDAKSSFDTSGIHLTPAGYERIATTLADGLLGVASRVELSIEVSPQKTKIEGQGAQIEKIRRTDDGIAFWITATHLPASKRLVKIDGLVSGSYALRSDGGEVAVSNQPSWSRGVLVGKGPDFAQRKALRAAIVRKNRLYFHRWRPRNVAFLTGERNREQMPSHGDVPKFTPLVEKAEKEIHALAKPKRRAYTLSLLPKKGGGR